MYLFRRLITRSLSSSVTPATVIDPATIPVWTQKKTPMEYIASVAPIEIEGTYAICNGGHPVLGHPVQFIQLDRTKPYTFDTCKYCGLRFVMKQGYSPAGAH